MKSIILIAALFFTTCLQAAIPTVDEYVLICFKRAFPQVENVNWGYDGKYWIAGFKVNEKQHILYYNKQGEVEISRRYYGAEELSPFMRARLHKRFAGKKIYGVTEVTTGGNITYSIVMEDAKKWYVIEANSKGVMQQVQKFNKG
jgi:hypothetical protein